jgi:anthranilate phosphoribosyltransferase
MKTTLRAGLILERTIVTRSEFIAPGSNPAFPDRECDMDDRTLAGYIREIGRGAKAAGDLSRNDARSLYSAMLGGLVPDLQLGAILLAMRVKGESLEELAGFVAAAEASYNHLPLPSGGTPVVIPSYNGARQLPNLVPLLALLLARAGIPVLIHGVTTDPGRITTREVLAALGIEPSFSANDVRKALDTRGVAFMSIEALAPEIAVMLALRAKLGVRNSTHTVVKMLQPFAGAALRIVSVTHPDYLARMREYFTTMDTAALALRGAEGEAVAHPRREPWIEWLFEGEAQVWKEEAVARPAPELPQERDAAVTACWIEAVLAGRSPVPRAIAHQVECCRRALAAMESASGEHA